MTPPNQEFSKASLVRVEPTAVLDAVRRVVGPAGSGISLHEPEFGAVERKYVLDCIDTGWVSSVGAYVDRFESMLVEFTGARRAIAVSNGTSALHICLRLAGVVAGDEVLIPALTFVATANAVVHAEATPHFVDSEPRSLGVDSVALETYLEGVAQVRQGQCFNRLTGARIRALVPVHIFGHPADMIALAALCQRWRLQLVEDAAESLGSQIGERHAGRFGLVSALSFNGNKIITTGGGGAILTDDEDLGRRAKHITTTARVPHQWSFLHDEVGYNYRLPNLNAALGCAQMEKLGSTLARKRLLAERYLEAFAGVEGARILDEPSGSRSNFWLVGMLIDRADMELRDELLTRLNGEGYMSRPLWTLMHRLPMFRSCPRAPLPVAEDLEKRVINLPSSPKLADR